ncbi:MAG TPA: hypothetical protein VJR22_06605 [Candidatus Nitrosotalea sp.]|nr:hypothetical protein [Candidatus Nitrosotalea sp.]
MTYDDLAIKKNLVSLAIGKTLIDIDARRYAEVTKLLDEKYNTTISDCYEHPIHLRETLKELYGSSYKFLVESIKEKLADFPDHLEITKFLDALSA